MQRRWWVVAVMMIIGGLLMVLAFRPWFTETDVSALISPSSVSHISVPPGFTVNLFASGLKGPRFIRFGPDGALYVAERGADRVIALEDHNGDGVAEISRVFADRLDNPHSLVFRAGVWYVGVPSGVVLLADRDNDGKAEHREVLIRNYPTGGHSTRTVEFLPDGRMVVSIGSSCNACLEDDPRRATVLVYDGPNATRERIFAKGCATRLGWQYTLAVGSCGRPITAATGSATIFPPKRYTSCVMAWIMAGHAVTTAPLSIRSMACPTLARELRHRS